MITTIEQRIKEKFGTKKQYEVHVKGIYQHAFFGAIKRNINKLNGWLKHLDLELHVKDIAKTDITEKSEK